MKPDPFTAMSNGLPVACCEPEELSQPIVLSVAYTREAYPGPVTARLWNALRSALKPVVLAFARLWLLAAWARNVSLAPDIAMYNSLSMMAPRQLLVGGSAAADVDDGLRDGVIGLDHLRVRLEV